MIFKINDYVFKFIKKNGLYIVLSCVFLFVLIFYSHANLDIYTNVQISIEKYIALISFVGVVSNYYFCLLVLLFGGKNNRYFRKLMVFLLLPFVYLSILKIIQISPKFLIFHSDELFSIMLMFCGTLLLISVIFIGARILTLFK